MERLLTGPIYLFFGLSVLHWAHVNRLMHEPPGCGNVMTDPFTLLATFFGPLAAVGLVGLGVKRFGTGRRPCLPWLILPLFFGTVAGLVYEAHWFEDYGIEIGRIWWLPRF